MAVDLVVVVVAVVLFERTALLATFEPAVAVVENPVSSVPASAVGGLVVVVVVVVGMATAVITMSLPSPSTIM